MQAEAIQRPSRILVGLAILAVLLSLACGPLGAGSRDKPTATPAPTSEPTAVPPPTSEPTPTSPPKVPTSTRAAAGQEQPGGPDASVPEDVDLIECPPSGRTMILKFSAHIAVDYEGAHLEHNLEDGILGLIVEGDGTIATAGAVPIPYNMSGKMRDCALAGEGTMTPSVTGHCQNGVVYLTIVEDWGPLEGTMTCRGQSVPFNVPPMGAMTHAGANGNGEVFYLDKGFSTEGAGYTSIRPFQGPSGSGDHIWTLFYDYTGVVR